jgi:hypothetical protein
MQGNTRTSTPSPDREEGDVVKFKVGIIREDFRNPLECYMHLARDGADNTEVDEGVWVVL